jgi:hypothetical protein
VGSSLSQNLTFGSLSDLDTTPSQIAWVNGDRDQHGDGFRFGGPHGFSAPSYPPHSGWWNRPLETASGLLAAVTRATEVITNPILRTTWINMGPNGAKPLPLWMQDPMLFGSSPGDIVSLSPVGRRLSSFQFWDTIITHALWFGCGSFIFQENYDGRPIPGTFMILNPYLVDHHTPDGHIVIDPGGENPIRADFDGRFRLGGEVWRYSCLRGMAPNDGVTPEGVFERHFDVFRIGVEVQGYVSGTFRTGIPAGFLKVSTPNAPQAVIDGLKKKWMDAHGGKRGIAVLNATTDFTPVSIKPVDSEISTVKKINLMDVAHAFGLSASWLDTGDGSLTYANLSDRRRDLVDHTLTAWGDRFMEVLSSLMPYGSYCRINWSSYTSPNVETMMQPLVMAVQSGIMTIDEARKYLQLEDRDAPSTAKEEAQDRDPVP